MLPLVMANDRRLQVHTLNNNGKDEYEHLEKECALCMALEILTKE